MQYSECSSFTVPTICRRSSSRGLGEQEPDEGLSVRLRPRGSPPTQAERGWVTPSPPSVVLRGPAEERSVAASNGHRGCGATSQVMYERRVFRQTCCRLQLALIQIQKIQYTPVASGFASFIHLQHNGYT
ncbi:hypothetical protein KUCAC02_007039 [Chaenocephalus aceratus]|nr:hypothetical protein KUCAC02_007039 [Chaenocephalus aceratus]